MRREVPARTAVDAVADPPGLVVLLVPEPPGLGPLVNQRSLNSAAAPSTCSKNLDAGYLMRLSYRAGRQSCACR